MKALANRLVKLEASAGKDRSSASALKVRRWLGERLTSEEMARLAEYEASQPPFDPRSPVDTRGWSQRAREWLGFFGLASEAHVAGCDAGQHLE